MANHNSNKNLIILGDGGRGHVVKEVAEAMGMFSKIDFLDELPQILNIIAGSMATVGPRPTLWNQFDLIAERDKYGANYICPKHSEVNYVDGEAKCNIHLRNNLTFRL